MEGEWLTYEQAAERLRVSPEAIRQRAIRGRWQRTAGNDGRARVRLPEGVRPSSERASKRPVRQVVDPSVVKALEAHVETVKTQLAASDARVMSLAADLAAERGRADKAIAAFADLARRLNALAEERARPWWRRLRITGGREAKMGAGQ
jgi:hypothetical protein